MNGSKALDKDLLSKWHKAHWLTVIYKIIPTKAKPLEYIYNTFLDTIVNEICHKYNVSIH